MGKYRKFFAGYRCTRSIVREVALPLLLILTIKEAPIMRNNFHLAGDWPYLTVQEAYQGIFHEKKALGLEGVIINIRFESKISAENSPAYTKKNKDGSYEIILQYARGRNALRHELFHVYQWETKPQYRTPLARLLGEWEAQDYVDGLIKPKSH